LRTENATLGLFGLPSDVGSYLPSIDLAVAVTVTAAVVSFQRLSLSITSQSYRSLVPLIVLTTALSDPKCQTRISRNSKVRTVKETTSACDPFL